MVKQAEQQQTWWQKNKKLLMRIGMIALLAVVIVLIILIILGYIFNWDWTGLSGFNGISIATDEATTPQKITKTIVYQVYQPGKTLWDWLQLLIIPAVLAVAGYIINLTISRGEQEATTQRDKTEREIAEDNQHETALQAYIDKMSELILNEHLSELTADGKLKPEYEQVRNIARVRTLRVMSRLDGKRKGSVLQFLFESGLIDKDKPIINMNGADLGEAILRKADLRKANLRGAILREADLTEADLTEADLGGDSPGRSTPNFVFVKAGSESIKERLRRLDLNGADLTEAILREADLTEAILSRADLRKAILNGADLRKADLTGADLTGADLSGDSEWGNTFTPVATRAIGAIGGKRRKEVLTPRIKFYNGANLTGAIVSDKQLHKAKSLRNATMPDGKIYNRKP